MSTILLFAPEADAALDGTLITRHGVELTWEFDSAGFGVHAGPSVKIGYPGGPDQVDVAEVDEMNPGATSFESRAQAAAVRLGEVWVDDGAHFQFHTP